ncbi:pentapeptide repeat-containing protein [Streptomyces sp. NPDC002851]
MPSDPEAADALRAWSASPDDTTTLDASGLNLSGADLSRTDLATALLIETDLRHAKLVGADLYRANLAAAACDDADLSSAWLSKADLRETSLRRAALTGANLGSAELWQVDARAASFRGATLHGAGLFHVQVQGADLTDATVNETSFEVVLDGKTAVRGLTGTVFGPAHLDEGGALRELAGLELELWLNGCGASVDVLNSPPGTVTYYARIDDEFPRERPAGILRRRRAGQSFRDEAFTRNLRWEPTEYLRLYELGHNEDDHVEITEAEANQFISRIIDKLRNTLSA